MGLAEELTQFLEKELGGDDFDQRLAEVECLEESEIEALLEPEALHMVAAAYAAQSDEELIGMGAVLDSLLADPALVGFLRRMAQLHRKQIENEMQRRGNHGA